LRLETASSADLIRLRGLARGSNDFQTDMVESGKNEEASLSVESPQDVGNNAACDGGNDEGMNEFGTSMFEIRRL
jgi:hypothetical protein